MKNWFYESKLLLPFFSIILFFLIISFAFYTSNFDANTTPFISNNGEVFRIGNEKETMKNSAFLEFIDTYNSDITITRGDYYTKTIEIYSTAPLKIEEEKTYNFSSSFPLAVLSNDMRGQCIQKDGKFIYYYGNQDNLVEGWFNGSLENSDYTCVVNLKSVLEVHANISFAGTFTLDAGENTSEAIEELETICNKYAGVTISRLGTVSDNIAQKLEGDNKIVFITIGLLTVLLSLNILRLLDNWLLLKEKECWVRSLLGADKLRLALSLAKDFFLMIACSIPIGAGGAWVMSWFHPFTFVSFKFSLASCIYGILALLLLGVVAFCITLLLYNRKSGEGNSR